MPTGTLIIAVTENDSRIPGTVFGAVNGLEQTFLERYWKEKSLAQYSGGGVHPLVLVGHANQSNFVLNYTAQPRTYISGLDLSMELKRRGLNAGSFRFCLLAGCRGAAHTGRSGLYINIGDQLGLPTVASTTEVSLGMSGGVITLKPILGGIWKVYFPADQEVFSLDHPRCADIAAILAAHIFRAIPADPP